MVVVVVVVLAEVVVVVGGGVVTEGAGVAGIMLVPKDPKEVPSGKASNASWTLLQTPP